MCQILTPDGQNHPPTFINLMQTVGRFEYDERPLKQAGLVFAYNIKTFSCTGGWSVQCVINGTLMLKTKSSKTLTV